MTNPLSQYFRQPAIYIKLPSDGKYYTQGALNMPPNRELPVLPMTAIDEITYRTPDALYNGSSTVSVIQSCVPDIKDAWSVPATDLDTLLVGIRIASYGHEMEFESKCPACGHEHELSCDLRAVLDSIQSPDYSQKIQSGDLEIYFRPMTYKNLNDNNMIQFEQQKILASLPDSDVPETDKMLALSSALRRMTELTVSGLSQSVATIKTPQAMVNDLDQISEFLKNCDRKLFNQIRDYVVALKEKTEMQPLKITCPECNNQYDQPVTMDMASFFASAS